jgi:hypothetical protein
MPNFKDFYSFAWIKQKPTQVNSQVQYKGIVNVGFYKICRNPADAKCPQQHVRNAGRSNIGIAFTWLTVSVLNRMLNAYY